MSIPLEDLQRVASTTWNHQIAFVFVEQRIVEQHEDRADAGMVGRLAVARAFVLVRLHAAPTRLADDPTASMSMTCTLRTVEAATSSRSPSGEMAI